jgi:Mrp family chromosome partitioning ATPase
MARKKLDFAAALDEKTVEEFLRAAEWGDRQSWVLTGPTPGVGTTTVTLAIARAISDRGNRVIVVDANVTDARIHDRFGLPPAPGFADIVNGTHSLKDSKQLVDRTLSVVAAGTIDPATPVSMAPGKLAMLVNDLRQQCDIALFDAPSLESSLLSLRLGAAVDKVLLVVAAGRTRRNAAREARDALTQEGATVCGMILNRYRDYIPRFVRRRL